MNPTTETPQIEMRDPNDLRPHKLIKPMPRWEKGSPEWTAFLEDIRTHGIQTPLIITSDGQLIDGETRRRAAVAVRLESVPCEVIPPLTAIRTVMRQLLLRRNLTKGGLAYAAYPIFEPAHEEARQYALSCLTRSTDTPSPHSVRDVPKRVEDFAAEMGVSVRLFQQAARVHEIFCEDPEFRDEMEPRILDTSDPVGLGAVIAGYGGRKATSGKAKGKRAEEQLELFTEAWSGLGKRFAYWGKMDVDARERALPVVRKAVAAMPPDLRAELRRAITQAEREEKAA